MLVEWHEVGLSHLFWERKRNVLQSLFLLQELQCEVQKTKEAFLQNSTLLDRLPQPAEPNTHVLLSSQMHSLQRASYLEKMLLVKTNEFEVLLTFSIQVIVLDTCTVPSIL